MRLACVSIERYIYRSMLDTPFFPAWRRRFHRPGLSGVQATLTGLRRCTLDQLEAGLLKRWLARIAVPTLVLWGTSDGVVTPAYGRAYTALIPGARFDAIPAAGTCRGS